MGTVPRDADRRLPRSWSEWRERMRDAWRFGEHVSPPMVLGGDLALRAVLLMVVAVLTGALVALFAAPGIGIIGKTVGAVTDKFDVETGSAVLPNIAQRSVVVDRNGKVLATLAGEENRKFVPLRQIPRRARNAVIAVEDTQFYQHHGVDLAGLVRATLLNFRSGSVRQGGSTITQQLVKNTLVGTERTLERKIKEAKLAVELEKTMTKDEILELYLNETYFGNGVYGMGTAAEFYFGRPAKKMPLAQSALLAGLIKAPESYEPLDNPEAARARRTTVLRRMLDEQMITSEQYERANAAKLGAEAHDLPGGKSPYFVEFVKLRILEDDRFGESREERARALFQGGLRIETTLDLGLQDEARDASEGVLNLKDDPASALVSIDPKTGGVVAMVGGEDFEESKFNLAVQALRQPGSTFKPVTMVAALEAGITPTHTLNTPSPLKVQDPGTGRTIKVHNYDRVGHGLLDMRRATELSVNTYYMQLIQEVGPAEVVDAARRLGVRAELDPVLSLALGTLGVPPLEMASAYATLANNGVHCEPFAITRVTGADGSTIIRNEPKCERTISASVAAAATQILRGVPERGTGRANGQIGRPVTGKTGTTDEYTDSWYAGYTPQFATVVWIGFPESTERSLYNIHGLAKVFGGSLPAMIWSQYMRAAHEGLPVEDFPKPPRIGRAEVPDVRGMTFAEARDVLEGKGFTVQRTFVTHHRARGTVLGQDPSAGTRVTKGSVISLRVSNGAGEPPTQCSDGKDNDGDGKVDGDDPACSSADDDDESDDPPPPKQCADGKDNDGDGKIDDKDPGCKNANDDDESDDPKPSPSPSDAEGGD